MTIYTENCSRSITDAPLGLLPTLAEIFRQWIRNQQLKYRIYQERRQLEQMSDAMLKDIGVSRLDAELEARRSDIPPSRDTRLAC